MMEVLIWLILLVVVVTVFLGIQRNELEDLRMREFRAGMPECKGCDVCQPEAGWGDVPLNGWINSKCEAWDHATRRKR